MSEDYRTNRLEEAIDKLTDISSDLNKMIAVHELRLNSQEKQVEYMEDIVEKRREETETRIQTVYEVMNREDNKILDELEKMRQEQKLAVTEISEKISKMEKMMWVYMGGFSVLSFFFAYGDHFTKIIDLLK